MGYSERREREIQSRRQSILDCSRGLFDVKGFAGTTMDDIAAAADLTKATVYKYFCSKQEILGSLLLLNLQTLIKWFSEADEEHADLREKLSAYGAVLHRFMHSEVPSSMGSYLLYFEPQAAEMSDSLKAELREHLRSLFGRAKKLFDDGAAQNIFTGDFDAAKMSLAVWGAAIGIQVLNSKLTPHILPDFREDAFNEIIRLAFRGLLERQNVDESGAQSRRKHIGSKSVKTTGKKK